VVLTAVTRKIVVAWNVRLVPWKTKIGEAGFLELSAQFQQAPSCTTA